MDYITLIIKIKLVSFISNCRNIWLFSVRAHRAQQGFSLLELALVLAILGVVGGLSVPLLQTQIHRNKTIRTEEHQEIVMTALGHYVARTGQLPCPAADSNGVALKTCVGERAIGYIPYKTLGVAEATAVDGYRHPMVYAIEPHLAQKKYCEARNGNILQVVDHQKMPVIDSQGQDFVASVILSVGEAYQNPGSVDEHLNVGATMQFVDRPYSNNKENVFRHKLKWASHQNLIAVYGKSKCDWGQAFEGNAPGVKNQRGGYAHLVVDD